MDIKLPPELEKMLKENPDLEMLHVSVIFNKKEPLTKRYRRTLAHDLYETALEQLEQIS